ncbi:MAG: hypothetical protein JST55_14620 [Bacteroidetes bacterium]|nr:hypothetical protein [Bacteroidota bacterium]
MNEDIIIPYITQKLQEWLNTDVKWKRNHNERERNDGELTLKLNGKTEKFIIEAKVEAKKQTVPVIIAYKKKYPDFIFMAHTIYPEVRKTLKDCDINYIDGAGNMYIKTKNNFLFIEGQKTENNKQKYKGRLFEKTGLKILFAFLVNGKILNCTYRQIAGLTGTALGTIDYVIKELKAEGYALDINKNEMKLNKTNELMNKWINGYDQKLQKNINIGTFRLDKENWKELPLNTNRTLWGGEPAAAILTKYLHPEVFTIYTDENYTELIKNYRLIPDENGNVIVNKKFWQNEIINTEVLNNNLQNTVPPLLVYADLINTAIPRNIETAKIIYEKYLEDKFN